MTRHCHECGESIPFVAACYCPECGTKMARTASTAADVARTKHRLGDMSPGVFEGDGVIGKVFAGPRRSDLYIVARNGTGSDLLIQTGILNAKGYERVGPLVAYMLGYGPSSHSDALAINRKARRKTIEKVVKTMNKKMVRETRREMKENQVPV